MGLVRRRCAAVVIAAVMAIGFGAASLDAQGKGKGKPPKVDPRVAICSYLASVIAYEGVDPTIKLYAEWLYFEFYDCDAM